VICIATGCVSSSFESLYKLSPFLAVFLKKKIISAAALLGLSCSFSVQVSLLTSTVGVSNALYIRGLV
jgi:hypothetical protein